MQWNLPASSAEFRGAIPFPHIVIEDFLDATSFAALQREFPGFDVGQAKNERGEVGGKATFPNVRALGTAYRNLDDAMRSREFLRDVERATGIPELLYDPAYVGGGCHLNMSGQDLDLHVDFNFHPQTRTHRRLNLILFLNDEWQEDWGGCLELQEDPHDPAGSRNIAVTPRANRAVVFETSERSWHGFSRIHLPQPRAALGRRSFAVYFYTEERPTEEIAPPHGTFYMARPLPDRVLEPGYTLTPEDVWELQVLVKRRDTLIDHLYRRELEFARVLHSPSVRLGQALTAPLRWLKRKM